jgi:hypothetical protein
MKRNAVTAAAILVSALLILQSSTFAKESAKTHRSVSGPVTLQSWFYAKPDKNGLSATVFGCWKLIGAIHDQGGGPNWTNSTYANTKVTKPADKCHAWYPLGGYVLVAGVKTKDTTVYAVHTLTGKHGSLSINYSGTYDFVKTYQLTGGSWVITGGTGAYVGAHGEGTATASAVNFPHIGPHTATGTLTIP